jgi:hypothetical protein
MDNQVDNTVVGPSTFEIEIKSNGQPFQTGFVSATATTPLFEGRSTAYSFFQANSYLLVSTTSSNLKHVGETFSRY